MRRRHFLAAAPLAAVGLSLPTASVRAQTRRMESEERPGSAPAGADRFDRPDVHAGDRPVGASFGTRSAAYGRSGAAATAHPLATLAGIEILKAGGSAVDAAVAINACLGFLEPTSSGIGGDVFAMLWDPRQAKVVGLAGCPGATCSPRRSRSPRTAPRCRKSSLTTCGARWRPSCGPARVSRKSRMRAAPMGPGPRRAKSSAIRTWPTPTGRSPPAVAVPSTRVLSRTRSNTISGASGAG